MCGIVAYLGNREAYPILIEGLRKLEYRGYDSAGVALMQGNSIQMYKKKGRVDELDSYCASKDRHGNAGIAHTRWATHGEPNEENAHPHVSEDGTIALIHNGIIENYLSLKKGLLAEGVTFKSETDTEVLVHLIRRVQEKEQVSLPDAVMLALSMVEGTYALAILSVDNPDQLVVAKKGSPLLIGTEGNEFFVASDGAPIVGFTQDVVYLDDGDVGVLRLGQPIKIKNINDEQHLLKRPSFQAVQTGHRACVDLSLVFLE